MKKLILILSVNCISLILSAQELQPLKELYLQLPSALLLNHGYQTNLITNDSLLAACPEDIKPQTITMKQFTQIWWQQLIKSGQLAFEGRRRQQWLIQADRLLARLNQKYANQNIRWCQIKSFIYLNDQPFNQTVSIVTLENQSAPWFHLVEISQK